MSKDGNSYIIATNIFSGEHNDRGIFEVFTNTSGTWSTKGQILSGIATGEMLGTSLAINQDGTIIAAGGSNYSNMTGIIRIYMLENNLWIEKQNFTGKDPWTNTGKYVALNDDGSILAFSSPDYTLYENGITYPQCGYVEIYELTGGVYVQKGQTIYGDKINASQLGSSGLELSSDGSVIIIGSIGGRNVQVYEWNGNDWAKKGNTLTQLIDHNPDDDFFGTAVSINGSGNIIAVGCKYGDRPDLNDTGYVELYEWNGNNWNRKGSRLYGYNVNDETGGYSISLNNNGLIVCYGSRWHNYTGIVQVARFDTEINDWVLINGANGDNIISHNNLVFNASYGHFVSLNSAGTRFIVSAPYHQDGFIEIYDLVI